ncbi:MAG: hypothetical protein ABJF04_15115 [Reichenbachiella sp.]|uniref:hypothetical protein n=1 Tax=Reichenbachiella sp. TaxID=2184521 RepID=UPI0032646A89
MKLYTSISDLITPHCVALIISILLIQPCVTATAQTPASPMTLSISEDSLSSTYQVEIQLYKAALQTPKNILLTLKEAHTRTLVKSLLIHPDHIAGVREEATGVLAHSQSHFLFTIDSLSADTYQVRVDVLEASDQVISFEEIIQLSTL